MKKFSLIITLALGFLLTGCNSIDLRIEVHSVDVIEEDGFPYIELYLKTKVNEKNGDKYNNITGFKINGEFYNTTTQYTSDYEGNDINLYKVYIPLITFIENSVDSDVIYYTSGEELKVEAFEYTIYPDYDNNYEYSDKEVVMSLAFSIPVCNYNTMNDLIGPYLMITQNMGYYYDSVNELRYFIQRDHSLDTIDLYTPDFNFYGVFTNPGLENSTVGTVLFTDSLDTYDIYAADYNGYHLYPHTSLDCQEQYINPIINENLAFYCNAVNDGILDEIHDKYIQIVSKFKTYDEVIEE